MQFWQESSLRLGRPGSLGLLLLLFAGTAAAALQQVPMRERQVLDPSSDEWSDMPASAPSAPEGVLAESRARLAENKGKKAIKPLLKWLKEHPDDEHYYEAVFLLGEAYFQKGDYWAALRRYEEVAENSSGELFLRSNRRAMDVGRAFISGQKRILWGIFRLPAYDDGVEALTRVYERVPGTRMGELALRLKADYYFLRGDMQLAADEYANLAHQYPSGRFVQTAMLRSAEASNAQFPGTKFDDRPLLEADQRYRDLAGTFPEFAAQEHIDDRLEGIRQARAAKDLDIAKWYERTGRGGAAAFYYRLVLKDWPDTLAANDARTRLRALGADVEERPAPAETRPVPDASGQPAGSAGALGTAPVIQAPAAAPGATAPAGPTPPRPETGVHPP